MFTRQSNVLYVLIILSAVITQVQLKPIRMLSQAQLYLLKFGYLSPASTTYSATVYENIFRKALKDFQIFTGLHTTGELDVETIKKMSLPRCGVRERVGFGNHRRSNRANFLGSHWVTNNLTYNILSYPKGFEQNNIDEEIARAFAVWSESSDLNFTLKKVGPVHIKIKFAAGEHGDYRAFDGPGGILAHAFSPAHGGETHFDDAESWTIGARFGVNLFQTAAHQLGHSLGLEHLNVTSSIMHPIYYGYKADVKLHPEDVKAIEILYGKQNSQSGLPPDFGRPHLTADDELCRDPKIDTIFNSTDGHIYAFKGNKYYKISKTALAEGYPKYISDGWPGLPGDIDAAFAYKTGKTYFFKGTEYWRYSGRQMDKYFPKRIRDSFIGLPDHVDAAMVWNDIIYFYKGNQFWHFELRSKPQRMSGYPKSLSILKGLPTDLDAAIQLTKDVRFYFKGYDYYQVDAGTFTVNQAVPLYPSPLVQWWFFCKNASSTRGFYDHQSEDNINISIPID